jgi:ABC-type branched-subunit amino acid transport system substrate-binding protein
MRGAAGIWGPSCLASARLAEHELNKDFGIGGQPCELVVVDASDESPDVGHRLRQLVDGGEVDALVGMCISSVRQRIVAAIGGRVPFVYTCLYEGGDAAPGLYAIGETAPRQLRPSIAWISRRRQARRWVLVGNDYVWPRVSHGFARRFIDDEGGQVVAETYLPFGVTDYEPVLDTIRRSRADAVLISMVGQDAVAFNRVFGATALAGRVMRLSCAIEENQLLAIGADNTENLHVVLGYFEALDTDANLAFKARYAAHNGERAPTLNAIGQSLYEGMHFLAALQDRRTMQGGAGFRHRSARDARQTRGAAVRPSSPPLYLARAEGHVFRVIEQF